MTERQEPYVVTVPIRDDGSTDATPIPLTEAEIHAAHADTPAPVSGFEPALVLLDCPAWPVGGQVVKLLLVTVREGVPGREGVVVDATPAYRECVVRNFGELRKALGCTPARQGDGLQPKE